MLEELDKFLIGVKVDRDEQAAMIDMAVSALPDTKLANQFQSLQGAKTNFAGFSADEDVAAWGNWAGEMTDDDVAQVKTYLTQAQENATQALEEQALSDEDLAKAKVMLDKLFDIIVENVETKINDGGFVVKAGEEQLTMVAGGYLADGPKLEGLVKDFVNQLTEEKPELKLLVKLDDGSHDGVNFHRISFPVEAFEEGTEQAKALLGDPVELILGIGPNSIYAAAGKDAESTLKQIIDASKASPEKSIAPGKVVVHMAPIMQAVAGAAQKPEVQAQIAPMTEALEKASGKDGMVIESRPIDNGSVTRITMEEGLVRLIGVAVQQAMAAQAAGQFQAAPGGNF
jgi:hypothetical protein